MNCLTGGPRSPCGGPAERLLLDLYSFIVPGYSVGDTHPVKAGSRVILSRSRGLSLVKLSALFSEGRAAGSICTTGPYPTPRLREGSSKLRPKLGRVLVHHALFYRCL